MYDPAARNSGRTPLLNTETGMASSRAPPWQAAYDAVQRSFLEPHSLRPRQCSPYPCSACNCENRLKNPQGAATRSCSAA